MKYLWQKISCARPLYYVLKLKNCINAGKKYLQSSMISTFRGVNESIVKNRTMHKHFQDTQMRPRNKLSWHNFQECFSMSSFSPQNEKGLSLRLGSLYPLSTFFKLYKEITLRDFIMGYTLWRLRKRLWKFTKYHMNVILRSPNYLYIIK